ncbi:uncharacterized protein LOC111019921 [Momordica charantia]|uniref:Uncharacterized protein LOC111019921 n=1 Tax=Momordica charantia TaxID=3673 RepID=A0A6J1DE17_MOMCH|nr:uncharacterized protein LOC111019921 [Momordica charantia]
MASLAKLLRPLPRAFVFASSSSSSSSSFFNSARFSCTRFEPSKSFPKNFGSLLCNRVSNFRFKISDTIYLRRKCLLVGSQLSRGTILGASVVSGSISLWPNVSLAMDDGFMDDRQDDLDALDNGKPEGTLWELALRLWLPFLFCWTVLTNLNHPLLVASKVILFLLSTKPSPLSVYIFVEQLCHSSCQEPRLSNEKKCVVASKVEVQDYKVACVARVEIEHQKITLLGILGGWWELPPPSYTAHQFNVFLDKLVLQPATFSL